MKAKTIKIIYWILHIIFVLAMLLDGIGGITRAEAGQEVMRHLGYPIYALSIFGVAKLLGVIAILQKKFKTIKEWTYAGFTINFIGAAASRAFVGDEMGLIMPPLIALAFMLITYWLGKKVEEVKTFSPAMA